MSTLQILQRLLRDVKAADMLLTGLTCVVQGRTEHGLDHASAIDLQRTPQRLLM